MDFTESLALRRDDILDRCTKCGRCVEACPMPGPAGIDTGDSGAIAAGVLDIIRTGSGPEKSEAWVSACSGSGACIDACQDGINPRFMIRLARVARAAKKDADFILADGKARFQKMSRGVRVLSRLQLSPMELARLTRAPKGKEAADPEIVFYTGCNVLKTPHIALLCLDVMDRLGIRYAVYGGPSDCCGILQMRAGDVANAGRQGDRTAERFFGTGADQVLSWCPTCNIQFGEAVLPGKQEENMGMTMFSVYLANRLDELKPLFRHSVNKRVGLHEHAGANGVTESVIRILKAIPGLEYVDLEQPTLGYQCTSLSGTPAYQKDSHDEQLRAAERAGVTTLAGIYHSCHRDFCAHEKEWPFEVVNFMELVGEAMGVTRPDLFKHFKMMADIDAVIAECDDMIELHGLDREEVREVLIADMFGGKPPAGKGAAA
jgi:heterodisulfide reductase subunit D